MGYILFFVNCPSVWKTSLISEICLSACHAEYAALSCALRHLIPIHWLVKEMADRLDLPDKVKATIRSRAFEDNAATLQLATKQRFTNRTRYFNTKYHHFWSHVGPNSPGGTDLIILKEDTATQRGDYLTKSPPREVFERLRKLSQGW